MKELFSMLSRIPVEGWILIGAILFIVLLFVGIEVFGISDEEAEYRDWLDKNR